MKRTCAYIKKKIEYLFFQVTWDCKSGKFSQSNPHNYILTSFAYIRLVPLAMGLADMILHLHMPDVGLLFLVVLFFYLIIQQHLNKSVKGASPMDSFPLVVFDGFIPSGSFRWIHSLW